MSTRNGSAEPRLTTMLRRLMARDDDHEEKAVFLARLRAGSPEQHGPEIDRILLEENARLRRSLEGLRQNHEHLRQLVEQLGEPPWFPAVYLGPVGEEGRVLVRYGGTLRVVGLGEDVGAVEVGGSVFLNSDLDRVMASAPHADCGEIGTFESRRPGGRAIIRSREEELVVDLGGELREAQLRAGEKVVFSRADWLAFARAGGEDESAFFLEETPAQSFADVGGLAAQIEQLLRPISLRLEHPETTARYRFSPARSVLLVGPPGTGKTLLARALANELGRRSGVGRSRFMAIQPGQLSSMWYGQSEQRVREIFAAARHASEREPDVPVVLFFDEIDAIGNRRSESSYQVDQRVMLALSAELDGLVDRGNLLVVATTNRADVLDPALARPGRLGDLVLQVPRPNRDAAEDILGKYLPPDLPYGGAVSAPASKRRQELIQAAVSQIFASDSETAVAQLTYRDGTSRTIRLVDLISGALLEKVARVAIERACVREVGQEGEPGIQLDDVIAAVESERVAAGRLLDPRNVRSHVLDLRQDVDVVKVEPTQRRVERRHRFLRQLPLDEPAEAMLTPAGDER